MLSSRRWKEWRAWMELRNAKSPLKDRTHFPSGMFRDWELMRVVVSGLRWRRRRSLISNLWPSNSRRLISWSQTLPNSIGHSNSILAFKQYMSLLKSIRVLCRDHTMRLMPRKLSQLQENLRMRMPAISKLTRNFSQSWATKLEVTLAPWRLSLEVSQHKKCSSQFRENSPP